VWPEDEEAETRIRTSKLQMTMRARSTLRLVTLAGCALLVFTTQARASTILLDLEDPPAQAFTPISLNFTAISAATTLSVAGYQVPAFIQVIDNTLTVTGGGPNLLGQTWTFTPAPVGSEAFQPDDGYGTGVNGLYLAGTVVGSFDTFSQTFSTSVGQSYTYNFLFYNAPSPNNQPSELVVSVNQADVVPEPASLAMMTSAFFAIGGFGLWRRRRMMN
jgi:hypothetical protein